MVKSENELLFDISRDRGGRAYTEISGDTAETPNVCDGHVWTLAVSALKHLRIQNLLTRVDGALIRDNL